MSNTHTQDLVVTRVFEAPVEQVWKAWVDPEYVMQWWGPAGFTCPAARMDVREGATSLVCMRAPKEFGEQDMYSTWTYTHVVLMQRIEYIHNLADKDAARVSPAAVGLSEDFPQDVRNVIRFEDLGSGKTEMTVTEYGYVPGQWFDLSKQGLEQCLDKMGAIFARA